MAKWHAFFAIRPVGLSLLFVFSALTFAEQSQAADALFQLSIEVNENDPRLCLFVVTAVEERLWTTLKTADEEQFQRVLSLRRESQTDDKLPAMLGRYQIKDQRLEFKPAFPLVRGSRYQAVFDPAALKLTTNKTEQRLRKTYAIPLPDSKPPRVTAVYPSSKRLPANHLKFYIQFSEPMQQGEIFEHFSLFNKTQQQLVPRPFRHTELWSPDGKQLTLWFHPGRQKVGVNLNVELGAILNEGQEYDLRISPKWAALSGHPLGKEVKKIFTAVAMDERQPDIHKWNLNQPTAGTREPLIYELDEPLDYALLLSQLTLKDINAKPVPGKIELAENETVWRFIPDQPWQAGWYQLAVGTVIEDLAGNSLDRPFAIDLTKQQTPSKSVDGSYTMVFSIE
ncbi:Ig-like domain-containing protein [uncultured Gimesia sp.]|uniref:Ig-like domain-containing protein n=1 Tax=uncultured Gimesia sp. TaxID=1678688 RepID=UPI0030D7C772|tara:strand:+ start:87577 stop:88764 length:1188 start_codon:yes stop_codon:yes gene_type:complete